MNYLQRYQEQLGLNPDGVLGPKTAAAMMADLGISDKLVFAHMINQVRHESGGFMRGRENMNYSAQGLANVWARYSASGQRGGKPNALAVSLAHKPEAIGNDIYANRLGNGAHDGYKYRGFGGIQLTGKTNIERFLTYAGLPLDSDLDKLANDPKLFFLAGKFWFEDNHADKLCTGITNDCTLAVSRKVNLGTENTTRIPIGWDDRRAGAAGIFKAMGLA